MKTQILIKHYKYKDLTDACLNSLEKSILGDTDVLIIDSTEDEDYHYKDFPVEKIPNTVWLIESFNRFVKDGYDLYVYASNDVIFHPNWLEGIKLALKEFNKIGVTAPMYDQPGGGVLEMPVRLDLIPGSEEWVEYVSKELEKNPTYILTKHVDNVVFAFTGEVKNKIGLMDGNFPYAGWGANLDYCYRARQAGFYVAASGKSFIHHAHRGTYGKLDSEYVKKAEKYRDEYLLKKYGRTDIVW